MKQHPIRDYITRVLNGMAWGLFASLLIGLIIKQIGTLIHVPLLVNIGLVAQKLMGPAIGVGVARSLKSPPLVVISSAVVGALGAGSIQLDPSGAATIATGEPVGAFVASLLGAELARRLAGKTPVDIILVPMVTIVTGGLAARFFAPYVAKIMTALGDMLNALTILQPIPMGILLSVVMGIILTLPISSAALSISLGLSGLAAGAATIGCCCNMIGFAVISYRDNGFGGFLAQGVGTSMLQMPNIIKKPRIWLPAIVSSAILGPVSTAILHMESNASGAGMGTSGLVGQFALIDTMGASTNVLIQILVMHFLLPALLSYLVYYFMRKQGWIQDGDLKLVMED